MIAAFGCMAGISLFGTPAARAASTGDVAARLEVAALAEACAPERVQAVAASLPMGMKIGPIANGPKFAGGTAFTPAKGTRQAYCQITGTVTTNPRTGKTANFLATLPASWNRKYLQFGCFGHCGFLALNDATSPLVTIVAQGYPGQILEKGYASFGTDEGHSGASGGDWAIKGPGQVDDDAITDFLYRADKSLAQAGKAFTAAFYSAASGSPQTLAYAYFCGCSGGGRDALVAASYFPEEFDGIIAGSPYANLVDISFQNAGTYLATLRSPGADVPPALIAKIDPIVKARCDALDGVKDDLIQNPAACNFVPTRDLPICKDDIAASDCFTRAQAQTISTVVSGVTDKDGKLVQPGFSVSEIQPFFRAGARPANINDPVPWDTSGTPEAGLAPLGDATLRILANRNDPGFNTRALFSFGASKAGPVTNFHIIVPREEVTKAEAALKMGIGSDPANMAKLIGGRTKLMIWHNGSDEKLTPFMSYNFYKQLAALNGGYEKLQRSVRLFVIPGTSHCSMTGEGPGNFDALSAMEKWVEQGKGPDGLTASLFSKTSPMIDLSKTPLRTMPLCKFPEMARYDGKGDVNQAASWHCDASDKRMLKVGESGRQAGVID
jgi:feruloyl esterase